MFSLTQNTPTGGDCCAGYKVEFSKEYTVREFIKEVLEKYPGEWGYFELKNLNISTEYNRGRLLKLKFADAILDSKIVRAYASGGWSRMDYSLTVDITMDNKPGIAEKATDSNGCFQNGNNHAAPLYSLTVEQMETFDRLCNDIRLGTIELEQAIARLAMKQSDLKKKVDSPTNIVDKIYRKEAE